MFSVAFYELFSPCSRMLKCYRLNLKTAFPLRLFFARKATLQTTSTTDRFIFSPKFPNYNPFIISS